MTQLCKPVIYSPIIAYANKHSVLKCRMIADPGTPGPVLGVPGPLTLYPSPPPPPMYYPTRVPQVQVRVLHECMQLLYAQNH